MARILIPIDFSDCSINALRYGLSYAEKMESNPEIIIAHGYHIPVPAAEFSMSLNATVLEEFKKDAEDKYSKLKQEIPELNKPEVTFDIKLAFVLDAILKCVEEEDPDLVIMGTKGSSGLNEVIFGSNTSGVIKASKVPVIAVPDTFKEGHISRITLAMDYKEVDNISTLDIIKRLSNQYNAPVDIVHIEVGDEESLNAVNNIAKFFEDIDHEFHVIDQDNITDGINEFLSKSNSDLLAMLPRKHNLFERLFSRSITTRMAHHTKVPLLAIPA